MCLNRSVLVLIALLLSSYLAEARMQDVVIAVGSYKSGTFKYIVQNDRRLKKYSKYIMVVSEKDLSEIKKLKDIKVIAADIMISSIAESFKVKDKELIFAVNNSKNNKLYKDKGFIFDPVLRCYYDNPLYENYVNFILYLLKKAGLYSKSVGECVKLPPVGIYHPDSSRIFEDYNSYRRWYKLIRHAESTVVILFYQAYLDPLHKIFLDAIIKRFEKENIAVVPIYAYPALKAVDFMLKEHVEPDLIVSFIFKMSASTKSSVRASLNKLGVPIINVINLFSKRLDEWKTSGVGLSSFEVSWQVGIPEISGLIEPTVVSGRVRFNDYEKYGISRENLDFLVSRVKAWIRLKKKSNKEKRIAIIYYNHSPGKHNIGASYLNTFRSLEVILSHLRKKGYLVEGNVSYRSLKRMILLAGRNVGQWAKGELESMVNEKSIVMVPISTYKNWYNKLPEEFRRKVERDWGKPEETDIMVYKSNFVLPVIRLGNVVIAPQPARGVSGDIWKMYHSKDVWPHHQYIAFYLWLKNVFKADAVIHLGTHGTLEWLPGKEVGLYVDDPPFVLIQDMVDIYPYVVDDVGEGIQAKRRGAAVIIDHLTPVILKFKFYGKYAELYDAVQEYLYANDENLKRERLKVIKSLAEELGIKYKTISDIEHFLIRLKQDLVPYGLHTFGISPDEDLARKMAELIDSDDAFGRIVKSGPMELKRLDMALNGRYVPSGEGNDPVRNPASIPTGKNFYAFDPDKIPSKYAWNIAKNMVDSMLKEYLKKHGRYPDKISVVLWATETIRNEGINEAQILYLIGMKPVWDSTGKLLKVIPIDRERLGRPRIDVLVHASGLYRDMFPDKLKLISNAIKRAALMKEVDNFIYLNSKRIERLLVNRGFSKEEAKRFSVLRVFSEKVGDYGTGVSLMTANSGFWENATQVASVFVERSSFVYDDGLWGKPLKDVYVYNLSDVDLAVHSISSNLYRALDNDDVFQYLGGITLAVKALTGKFPEAKIVRSTGLDSWVESLDETLKTEMASRYFNPDWIKGMKKEGYAGAREIAKFVEYLWGWQVTAPFAVDDRDWLNVYNVYIKDKYRLGMRDLFRKNPWALQSLVGWLLEADRKSYWKAPYEVKLDLARRYVKSVIEDGVACCEHTCNNPFLNQYIINLISIPGVVPKDVLSKFVSTMHKATGYKVKSSVINRKKLIERFSTSLKKIVSGMELKERKERSMDQYSSGLPLKIMFFVFIITLLFIIGTKRAGRKGI